MAKGVSPFAKIHSTGERPTRLWTRDDPRRWRVDLYRSSLAGRVGEKVLASHAVRGRHLVRTRRDVHKLMNILQAATAAPGLFQSELCFELARHDDAGLSCFTDMRIGNSFAEAEVHGRYSLVPSRVHILSNDYDNRYQLCS